MCLSEPDVYSKDHYRVLGVQRRSTIKEISAAYKRLALKYHPDKNLNNRECAAESFRRVAQAYESIMEQQGNTHDDDCGNSRDIDGLGSLERAEKLYRRFFDTTACDSTPDIDIAGIFRFNQKPYRKSAETKSSENHGATQAAAIIGHVMPAGTHAVIHCVGSKPELNGKAAVVKAWIESRVRYEVQLNCGAVISLRPQNLTQACRIQIAGLESASTLNGKYAEIYDYSGKSGLYMVLLADPMMTLELSPENCILPATTPVVLQDLTEEELNDTMAQIIAIDRPAARYVVQCSNGRQLRVKYARVRC